MMEISPGCLTWIRRSSSSCPLLRNLDVKLGNLMDLVLHARRRPNDLAEEDEPCRTTWYTMLQQHEVLATSCPSNSRRCKISYSSGKCYGLGRASQQGSRQAVLLAVSVCSLDGHELVDKKNIWGFAREFDTTLRDVDKQVKMNMSNRITMA